MGGHENDAEGVTLELDVAVAYRDAVPVLDDEGVPVCELLLVDVALEDAVPV